MRTPIVAGNWKMNTTVSEAIALAKEMRGPLDELQGVDKIVFPPFISLTAVAETLAGSSIRIGAQNMHHNDKGAFTGEISPVMLSGVCRHVILGHSERRNLFHEDDAFVNRKVAAALDAGLSPILAVGERLEEREAGHTVDVITRQIRLGLESIPASQQLIVAYEPVWAIGTGKAASAQEADETTGLIRRLLAGQYGEEFAGGVRILYGGSVTAENVAELMAQPEIDGGLIGGASLKPAEFISIARQAAEARRAA